MKELLIKIKNIIKKSSTVKIVNPHTNWNNLLYIFFTITVVLISFSIYLLISINNEQSLQMETKTLITPTLVDEKLLQKVTESFNNKAAIEKQIQDGLIFYKDPSI